MHGLFVVAGFVMLGRFVVMLGSVCVVFGGFLMGKTLAEALHKVITATSLTMRRQCYFVMNY